ncbi:hypothetical protein V2J09_016871 [Rumex salicifolius]
MLLFLLKLKERKLALICMCRSRVDLDRITRVVADYMKYEHTLSTTEDATTMQGYKYLVGIKETDETVASREPPRRADPLEGNRIMTLETIWQSQGWLLGSRGNSGGHLKDMCLSFALFWLLLRRFADYELDELSTEESRLKTRRFVRAGLIKESDDEDKACERAFKVVEVELDFLYDYFYNNYYSVYSRGRTRYLLVRLGVVELAQIDIIVTSKWVKKKLQQYSLLDSYGHTPKASWFKCILDGYINFPTDGQKEIKLVKLSTKMMKAVIQSLCVNGQTLSNGAASLERNQVHLSWACKNHTTNSHVILIWHIATSICEMSPIPYSDFQDAANFSGAKLGKQLMNIEDARETWKVLEDFRAEMILYLAPSKDASVHAEYLVSGGEFLTHLWVLLTHPGIVDRV